MQTIYLAARYSRFEEMQGYAAQLRALGHVVTSRWILGDHDLRAHGEAEADHWQPLWAAEDFADLCAADIMVNFTEGPEDVLGRVRGGRHVEFGAALGIGKRCLVIGYRENIFHWLPCIKYFPTWEEALAALHPRTRGTP